MSEDERKVLDQLEQEFRPNSSPSRSKSRWSGISATKRRLAGAAAVPVGLAFVILGLVENNAGGLLLALMGYGLVVSGAWLVVDCMSGIRVALVRSAQPRTAMQRPRPRPRP